MARAEGILRLLLVDDSLTDADIITNSLRSAGHAVRASRYDDLAEIEQALTSQSWDLVICRDSLATIPPRELLNLIQRLGRDIPCILLTSDQENREGLFGIGPQDVVSLGDSRHLQFSVVRELQNLFMRRLSRRNERALRESEKRARLLLESSRDAVAYMHEGMHIYVNNAYLTLFGYEEAEDIDGLPMLDMIMVDDHAKFKAIFRQFSEHADTKPQKVTVQCLREDGSEFQANMEFSHTEVEGEDCTQVVIRDEKIPAVPNSSQELLLEEDLLTGLYSREHFIEELENAVDKAGKEEGDSELLYIVIDDFHAIKELVGGLGASDVMLQEVADLLHKALVEGESLARYSDQVYTIILASDDDTHVEQRAEAFRKVIDDYVSHTDGKTIDLHCSIGICRITESVSSAGLALDNADKACVLAQQAGGNRVVRHPLSQSEQEASGADDSSMWQERIQDAIQNGGLCLHYQPIVSLHGEEQELYDVLLRLKDTDNTLITPDNFISHVEQSELMADIDEWVINHALANLATHRKKHPKTRFFIRLSKQTLHKAEFVDWLCKLLNSYDLDGAALVFEISETAALENLEDAKATVSKLKNVGCEFGLEHFGSGLDFSHSLNELDVDYLKINGTFVENMTKDSENQAAVKAIIEMTKEAEKRSIAEFVSDANSLALLWRLGVDYAQGYYIHEPSENLDYNFEDDDL